MLEKNQTYQVNIESYGCNGEGIARKDGTPVFIENALKGETVEILIVKVLKNFAYGKLLRVLEASPHRKEPICPVFKRCGGCQMLHMAYDEQLRLKTDIVKDCMRKFSGLKDFSVADAVGMNENPYHYRNKAQYPVEGNRLGFYAPRSHDLIAIDACPVQNERDKALIRIVEKYPYTGEIRHLYTRTGKDEYMAVLVTRSERLRDKDYFIREMKEAGVTTLVQNINPGNTNVILGKTNITLYGEGKITGEILGLKFVISPHSFFQINTVQTEKLYSKAKELLDLKGHETLMDLYCGIGSIGLTMADKVKKLIGVECVPQAIENAIENAKANDVQNAEFIVGLSEEVFPRLLARGIQPDAVIIDPPRKGCDEQLLATLKTYLPEKIVYISCNPSTLARDLKILSKNYKIGTVYPYDLFPHTKHVECVVSLTRSAEV